MNIKDALTAYKQIPQNITSQSAPSLPETSFESVLKEQDTLSSIGTQGISSLSEAAALLQESEKAAGNAALREGDVLADTALLNHTALALERSTAVVGKLVHTYNKILEMPL